MSDNQYQATPSTTTAFRDAMVGMGRAESAYRRLGRSELQVSVIGFGGYRIHPSVDEHSDALQHALAQGCNLIDTSTNYGDGASERLVGRILASSQRIRDRDEVVIVSKVGYIQGTNLSQIKEAKTQGRGYPEVVAYQDTCWHCIHPQFLCDQLQHSINRLGVETVDVMLLHNPEYFLSDCKKRKDPRSLDERRDVFYERIERAFECLEQMVANGEIGHYGVSSNTFVEPTNSQTFTSLTRMIEIARKVAGDKHHFSVIQFPMNLVEANAVQVKNNGPNNSQTLLEVALNADMGVLVNRPLNAIKDGELLRLSDFDCRTPDESSKKLHKLVAGLEAEFLEGLATAFESGGVPTTELFRFSEPLKTVAGQITDAIQWDGYITQVFSPEISRRVEHVNEILSGPLQAAWHLWLERYVDAMSDLSDAYRVGCARLSQKRSDKIHSAVKPFIPSAMQSATLSQKALYCVLGQPGVTVALVGMRQPHYVDDALSLLDRSQMQISESALTALGKIK